MLKIARVRVKSFLLIIHLFLVMYYVQIYGIYFYTKTIIKKILQDKSLFLLLFPQKILSFPCRRTEGERGAYLLYCYANSA